MSTTTTKNMIRTVARVLRAGKERLTGLLVEAWDRELRSDTCVASSVTDEQGRCELVFDEERRRKVFRGRRAEVFFKVFEGGKLILDTRGSVCCSLRPGGHEVTIRVPKCRKKGRGKPRHSEPSGAVIEGRAVLAPGWGPGLVVEAFADAELQHSLGCGAIDDCGRFELELAAPVSVVWFAWSQGQARGRSPKLQPFSTESPIRLNVYGRWSEPARGRRRYLAQVRSTSGRPAAGMPVALLEVTLQRCQLLGAALTHDDGAAVISYDASSLFVERPDLRLVVYDTLGVPLLESTSGAVVLPGTVARTSTSFETVARVFEDEDLGNGCDLELAGQDIRYVVERTGLPARTVAAYSAATTLAPQLDVSPEVLFALADRAAPDLEAALEMAVAQDLASPDLLERTQDLLPRLAEAGTQWAAREDLGRGSLKDFLATQLQDMQVQEQVAGLILEHRRLSAIREKLEERQLATPQVRFLLDLQSIAGVDVPLATALDQRFSNEGLPDGQDLALLTTREWEQMLEAAHDDQAPGERRARAAALAHRAQQIFPDKVFRAQLERQAPWADRIRSYFARHPDRTFQSPLPLPLALGEGDESSGTPEDAAELAALTAYKRVHALTRNHTVVGTLLDSGLTSASDLSAIGVEELVSRFRNAFEDDIIALEETHSRALATTAALTVASSFLPVGPRPSLCECAQCRSIFGPAAYLFELLTLFRRYTTGPEHGHRSLLAHLEDRRPDITRTRLSCPNTTIEVPQVDLVNELLEDQILATGGTSVVHGLEPGECLPPNRQTEGTSEERRAMPQNQPSDDLLNQLAAANFPWTLPYDYHRDRARSARDRLIARPEDIALKVWRSTVAADATSLDEATRALASSMLDLGDAQVRLITERSSLESAWGDEVAATITSGGPTLRLLARVAAIDLETVEAVLDAAFVRGTSADALAIEPQDFCGSAGWPRLTGSPETLADVLDRFHRFERLRRHLGWSVRDLDESLDWLGGTLAVSHLEQIGLLRFLERRLRLAPAQLLTLFRDPSDTPPTTLRPRDVLPAFDQQFGIGSSPLALPDPGLDEQARTQSVIAQITKASGESLETVDRVFDEGLLSPLVGVADLLSLPPVEAQVAYRRAVAMSYRLSVWASRLRIEASAMLDLATLGGLEPLSTSSPPDSKLRDALRLVDLAERSKGWPIGVSELRSLLATDPASEREHGFTASEMGALLLELRREIDAAHEAIKPLPADARAALRVALSRLLTETLPEGSTAEVADRLASELADAFEWSAFFPTRANDADVFLSHALREWPGLAAVAPPDAAEKETELNEALRSLEEHLEDWLRQTSTAPTTWPSAELETVRRGLESVVRRRLADPTADGVSTLAPDMQALFLAAGASLPHDFTNRVIGLAVESVSAALESTLTERAASTLSVVEVTSSRAVARQVLAAWVMRRFGTSALTAETLLEQLSDSAVPGQSIVRAFIDDTGAPSSRLVSSEELALRPEVQRLRRAAVALRSVSLPPTIWTALVPAAGRTRAVDLDALADGAPLADWLAFFGLASVVGRLRSAQAVAPLVGFLEGAGTARADLLRVLNLDDAELPGALDLLGVSDAEADTVVLPATVGFEQLEAVLELVDEARRFNLPSTALARWNEATPQEIHDGALAGLRVGLERSEWLKVLAEVTDPVREHLRDAQVDFLIGLDRDGATDGVDFSSREAISDYLLTDVQMSACMTTSRIQFASAAVQRYVDAGQGGRAPWLPRGSQEERFAREWVSMRQYRLHEAQMRILVHTENWIEPAIRPTKTPAFERLEQTMHSGPLTLHLAEQAMKEYAASLAEVARLEPVAIVTHEEVDRDRPLAFRDSELHGTHVFGRTRAHPRRLYYRRRLPLPDGRWTPWERIDADLEGTHFLAVVVFGRLRLICADFSVARTPRPDRCDEKREDAYTAAGQSALTNYEVTVSWIEREHGRWSAIKRSARFPFSIPLRNSPDEDHVFSAGLPGHFGDIEREVSKVVSSVSVDVWLVEDGLRNGSRMTAHLRNDSEQLQIGTFDGPLQPRGTAHSRARSTEIPSTLQGLTRLRLACWPDEDDAFFTDGWNIDRLRVRFSFVDGGSHEAEVPTGRRGQDLGGGRPPEGWERGGEQWEDVSLVGSRSLRLQGGHGRTAWTAFEGLLAPALQLGHVQPQQQHFDIEYEVIPQSLDLSRAVSIQAAVGRGDSFELKIYSVPHTERGRIRSRFRVTDETLRDIPETEKHWGNDWVTGGEFCYPLETDHAALVSLRVYSDDTTEVHPAPLSSMGAHEGTRDQGQALLSEWTPSLGLIGLWPWLSNPDDWHGPGPVYCDQHAVARSPVAYGLTVERTSTLSSWKGPKLLDERHDSTEPARTFFVERVGWAPHDPGDPAMVADLPDFEHPQRNWPRIIDLGTIDESSSATFPAHLDEMTNGAASSLHPAAIEKVAYLPRSNTGGTQIEAMMAESMPLTQEELRIIELVGPSSFPIDRTFEEEGVDGIVSISPGVWRFHTFWHPQAVGFRRVLESRGLPRLVRAENQELSVGTDLPAQRDRVNHFSAYEPTDRVDPRWPADNVDFTLTGPFSEYNWELFFDALLYIAQRFDEEGQYDEADEIFGLLVDRTKVAFPGAWDEWWLYQTAPIRSAVALEGLGMGGIVDRDRLREDIVAQIERIRANPYQPHLIARGWPTIYARALRIRYAEHLIRAGEADFRRAYASDNRTYLESASSRFDLAARVLGPAEGRLPAGARDEVACYASLTHGRADEPAEGIEVLEPYLPAEIFTDGPMVDGELRGSARWHFCVPANEKLDELRALVADRLLKLRSCEDIDGVRRALSLYGQQIDPALLVRATAEGLDIDVLLGRISSAKPSLYFQALWQRALQACERARALEDAWLNAEEREDSEEMVRLQNEQEIRALEDQAEVMAERLEDARRLKEALDRAIESAEIRHEFYSTRKRLNAQEEAEGRSLTEAGKADARAATDSRAASDWAWIPTAEIYADAGAQAEKPWYYARAGASVRFRLGGETGVQVYRANAEAHNHDAAQARVQAGLMGREGSFERRADDWKLQESLALKDIQRAEHDRAGAEIRVRIADLELDLHKRRIDDVKTVRAFLRDKFTSKELHAWRADRMRQLRYQQHRIAHDLVSQARAALVREHGLQEQGFVPDPWDTTRNGVAAAAGLLHELEKQQQLYMETWRREQEKIKTYSLLERDPLAFLELLQRGEAVFAISEADYDEDGPGDYFRRIRHISLDIPAVRGPYTNVNARLTQLRGEVRVATHRSVDGDYDRMGADDRRFRDDLANGEFIVTNTGMQDDGRVDQRQDGENPPPFAMNGAISTFRVELPPAQNHFDRQTVSDVIVRVALTSRPGGDAAAKAAAAARRQRLSERPQPVMLSLHSAFSNAWHRFVDALRHEGTGELALTFASSHIPLRLQPVSRIVQSSLYFALPEGESMEVEGGEATGVFSLPPSLKPIGRSIDDPHIPPPIHRLNLREPLRLGEERTVRIGRRSDAANLERGWLICWLEGTGEG